MSPMITSMKSTHESVPFKQSGKVGIMLNIVQVGFHPGGGGCSGSVGGYPPTNFH